MPRKRELIINKTKKPRTQNCVPRLSICTVDLYHTFSLAKNSKKEEPQLRVLRVETLDCKQGLKKMPRIFLS